MSKAACHERRDMLGVPAFNPVRLWVESVGDLELLEGKGL